MRIYTLTKWGALVLAALLILIAAGCCPPFCGNSDDQEIACSRRGTNSLFVATFDGDTEGSLPAPSAPFHYGPPGSRLELQNAANTIMVTNSTELGSMSLKIARNQHNPVIADAVTGDIGDSPYTDGTYYIDYRAHGEVVPQYLISGVAISVRSAENREALNLKLFDGAYHLRQGNSYDRLTGAYDPDRAHSVHIELNMDERTYAICINDDVVASNKSFAQNDFTNFKLLRFFAPATITEAFPSIYVVDDIRTTK